MEPMDQHLILTLGLINFSMSLHLERVGKNGILKGQPWALVLFFSWPGNFKEFSTLSDNESKG